MRLKHVKNAEEDVLVSPFVVQEPEALRGRFAKELFGNDAPVHIEIGMGKGRFITELAARHPGINYIGIEKFSSVLIKGVHKQEELQLPNLRFIRMDAEDIEKVFEYGEVSRIYLNFSDPWPKDRHAKRRLTSDRFLKRYEGILKPGDEIEFKTDNMPLFDYSIESVKSCGWVITYETHDLHSEPEAEENIMTEYEAKFSAAGNPIGKIVFHRD